MLFTSWEPKVGPLELAADVGGCDQIYNRTRESISLERKAQRLLRNASKPQSFSVRFEKIEVSELSQYYVVDVIRCKRKPNDRRLPSWPENNIYRCYDHETNFVKERIKIEGPSLDLLRWVRDTGKIELEFHKIAANEHALKSMAVEELNKRTSDIYGPGSNIQIDDRDQLQGSPINGTMATTPIHEVEDMNKSPEPNSPLINQAASIIDDDSKTSSTVKRRKMASAEVQGAVNETSADRDMGIQSTLTPNHFACDLQIIDARTTAFDPSSLSDTQKFILINPRQLKHNRHIIQFLARESKLKTIEQESPLPWDFILNPNTYVVRLQLNEFFQISQRKTLLYESALADLLAEFTKIIILLEYDTLTEGADKDAFWKVRHFLNRREFETYLTSDHHEALAMWIRILAQKYSSNFADHAFDSISEEEELLLALNFNRFQTKAFLSEQNISQLLLKALHDESQPIMTPAQRQRLLDLMLLEW